MESDDDTEGEDFFLYFLIEDEVSSNMPSLRKTSVFRDKKMDLLLANVSTELVGEYASVDSKCCESEGCE